MENFIRIYKVNKKICDNLINYHKLNTEYKAKGMVNPNGLDINIKESIDVNFYNQSNDKHIIEFFKTLSFCMDKYLNEFSLKMHIHTDMLNLIQYYPVNGGFKVFHFENGHMTTKDRKLVYMLYLNDVPDGGTEFKYQNIILEAKKGNLVIWPAEFTHMHKGVISKTKEKYIATGWLKMR
jgi:prolyl 4-hydroxylase